MSYLGRRGALAPVTSADIPDDSITAAKIVDGAVTTDLVYLENATTTQNLSGTYSTERMYLNDSYTLTGDVTVTGHLALGTVADSDVIITQDSTERTITGSGTLESGNLLQDTHRTSLTDMTGELGSVVTGSPAITGLGTVTSGTLGSGVTFPAGHIIKVSTHLSTADITKSASTGIAQESNGLTVSCTAGNKLHIWIVGGYTYATSTTGYFQCGMVIEETGQSDVHSFGSYLYQRTASGNYNNDSHPSVMYSHTAVTTSVTIKAGVHNPATAITSYWQAVNAYNSGRRYLVMEEQV